MGDLGAALAGAEVGGADVADDSAGAEIEAGFAAINSDMIET